MSEFTTYMWSVPDWRTDEMFTILDNREQGIYRNLIDECWVSGSIPNDIQVLARIVRETVEYFTLVWEKIRAKFKPLQGGKRLISARLEQDRHRLMLSGKMNQKRAEKAAKVRWAKVRAEKEIDARSNAQASSEHGFEQCQSHSQSQKEENSSLTNNSNIKKSPSLRKTARKTRAPAELPVTDAMRQWASQNGIAADLECETQAMLDFHRGAGNLKLDWVATWRTWMRNSKRFGGSNGTRQQNSRGNQNQPARPGGLPSLPYTPKQR